MFVTEDTTRAHPETLKALYGNAIAWGARRVCLADTVGHATPDGVRRLVRFVKEQIIAPSGEDVKLDWHGHRDRGMGVINCLAAIEAGADRVHATALGVGERVGNAEMDLLIVNLHLLGAYRGDLTRLPEYCRLASEAVGRPIAVDYPVMGADAFRTGDRRTRRRDREGARQGRCLARRPGLFQRAGRRTRHGAADRHLAGVGAVEREVLARGARL